MARIEVDPNYSAPTFSRATAATDPFKKEDVQNLAAAVSTHDHSTGKGVAVPFATAIPNGTITGAMIADGTIDTADLKDGAVTSAKILDGTIATGDLANAAVTNAKLGADTARLNLLTNGGFEIWQRGNGPFSAGTATTADRWAIVLVGGDTFSVSRDTANADGSLACAVCTSTHSAGSALLVQYVGRPGDGLEQLKTRTITFSVRVRTSTANAVQPYISADGNATVTNGAFHSGGGTYETLTVTLALGAATSVVVGIAFRLSCTAYIDNAMLVVGNVAADYAPLHPADDLARCLRYYELDGEVLNELAVASYANTGQVFQMPFRFKTQMAVTPTVTKNGTWGVTNCTQPGASAPGRGGFMMFTTVTTTGAFQFTNNAGGTFWSAEANP